MTDRLVLQRKDLRRSQREWREVWVDVIEYKRAAVKRSEEDMRALQAKYPLDEYRVILRVPEQEQEETLPELAEAVERMAGR